VVSVLGRTHTLLKRTTQNFSGLTPSYDEIKSTQWFVIKEYECAGAPPPEINFTIDFTLDFTTCMFVIGT
jgi:hypothetical protein